MSFNRPRGSSAPGPSRASAARTRRRRPAPTAARTARPTDRGPCLACAGGVAHTRGERRRSRKKTLTRPRARSGTAPFTTPRLASRAARAKASSCDQGGSAPISAPQEDGGVAPRRAPPRASQRSSTAASVVTVGRRRSVVTVAACAEEKPPPAPPFTVAARHAVRRAHLRGNKRTWLLYQTGRSPRRNAQGGGGGNSTRSPPRGARRRRGAHDEITAAWRAPSTWRSQRDHRRVARAVDVALTTRTRDKQRPDTVTEKRAASWHDAREPARGLSNFVTLFALGFSRAPQHAHAPRRTRRA
jgi:hypothetical protein